ncbi:MAG: hypothetical protein JW724_08015 [Candidatus Altiarchaeota archaeon]|nr:hypothetical protein [Candidatus Altiarchaeota archaeon]
MRSRSRKKTREKGEGIARERMDILFALARKAALEGDTVLAGEQVLQARRIGMKFNVPIPGEYKRRYCKHCYGYLIPSKTSRTRIDSKAKKVVVECFACGKKTFYPYAREVRAKRRLKQNEKKG